VHSDERGPRVALIGALALLGCLLVVGAALGLAADGSYERTPPAPPETTAPSPPPVTLTAPAPPPRRRAGLPTRLDIPAAGVRARILRLGLNRDGTLQVPRDFDAAGWWSGGARPGERGPAVIAGHVDSRTGPAVFFRLGGLRRGDRIRVSDRGGRASTFAVQRVARYPKRSFPTAAVYGDTTKPTLRLITCSGDFDASSGHYVDNTVVYATLIAG
jgi:hypothetical protein